MTLSSAGSLLSVIRAHRRPVNQDPIIHLNTVITSTAQLINADLHNGMNINIENVYNWDNVAQKIERLTQESRAGITQEAMQEITVVLTKIKTAIPKSFDAINTIKGVLPLCKSSFKTQFVNFFKGKQSKEQSDALHIIDQQIKQLNLIKDMMQSIIKQITEIQTMKKMPIMGGHLESTYPLAQFDDNLLGTIDLFAYNIVILVNVAIQQTNTALLKCK
jgi:hypothetical protein